MIEKEVLHFFKLPDNITTNKAGPNSWCVHRESRPDSGITPGNGPLKGKN
jgi:hypothetical protein